MNLQATVTGVDELRAKLNQLAYAGASRASGKAIRAGLKVLEKAQAAAVPVGSSGRKKDGKPIVPGNLKRSVGSRFLKSGKGRQRGIMSAKSGFNVGKKAGNAARGFHSHLFALGTMPRWRGIKYGRGKKGADGRRPYNPEADDFSVKFKKTAGAKVKYLGIMPANPALRHASSAAEPAAVARIRYVLLQEIDREVAKAR